LVIISILSCQKKEPNLDLQFKSPDGYLITSSEILQKAKSFFLKQNVNFIPVQVKSIQFKTLQNPNYLGAIINLEDASENQRMFLIAKGARINNENTKSKLTTAVYKECMTVHCSSFCGGTTFIEYNMNTGEYYAGCEGGYNCSIVLGYDPLFPNNNVTICWGVQ
jgi:hypothetical protein